MTKYKTIGVTGLGNIDQIEIPEDFTDEQIAAALKAHPEYREHGSAVRQRTLGFANSMAKGVPILGNLVNKYENSQHAPYSQELERDYPKTAWAGRVAGGMASSAPIAAGVAANTLPGLVRNTLAQGGTFAGLGAADKIAEKGPNATVPQVATATTLNGLGGMFGPLLGKVISPASPRYPSHDEIDSILAAASKKLGPGPKKPGRITKDDPFGFAFDEEAKPVWGHMADLLEETEKGMAKIPKTTPPSSAAKEAVGNSIGGAAAGYLSHHLTGYDPFSSMLVGGLMGNYGVPMAKNAVNNSKLFNQWINNAGLGYHPGIESVLNALGPSVVSSVPPPE